MSIVLLYAGATFSFDLLTKLREIHQEERAAAAAEIARRAARNVPLDGIADPGEFRERPALAGLTVHGVVLSARRYRELDAARSAAVQAYQDGRAAGAPTRPLTDAIYDANMAIVAAVITSIDGFVAVDDPNASIALVPGEKAPEIADALERVGLVLPLYTVAAHMQGISAKKA